VCVFYESLKNMNSSENARSTVTVMNRWSCNNLCRINTAVGRTNSDFELNYFCVV
jgi:hypothetical protein